MSTTETASTIATLVSIKFNYGKASGEDKGLSNQLCEENRADKKKGGIKAVKRVICPEAYAPLKQLASEMKGRLKRLTAAWDIDGVFVCKPQNLEKVIALRDEYFPVMEGVKNGHVLGNYDHWKAETQSQVGDAFSEDEFPSREQMEQEINWSMGIMPMPESDAFKRIKDIDEVLMAQLTASNDERIQRGIANGMAQAFDRLMAPLQNMVDVLTSDKPKIFESLVGNVRAVIAEIPGLNLADDSGLATFAAEAEAMIAGLDKDMLKNDPIVRQATVDKARSILATFGAVGRRKFAA